MKSKTLNNNENIFLTILKGGIIAVAITLVFILIFALIIKFFTISNSVIFPINQVIKVVSLFIAMLIVTKGQKERGLVKGMLLGLVYFLVSFIIFSILQQSFSIEMNNVYDMLLTSLMGGIVGLISVHISK